MGTGKRKDGGKPGDKQVKFNFTKSYTGGPGDVLPTPRPAYKVKEAQEEVLFRYPIAHLNERQKTQILEYAKTEIKAAHDIGELSEAKFEKDDLLIFITPPQAKLHSKIYDRIFYMLNPPLNRLDGSGNLMMDPDQVMGAGYEGLIIASRRPVTGSDKPKGRQDLIKSITFTLDPVSAVALDYLSKSLGQHLREAGASAIHVMQNAERLNIVVSSDPSKLPNIMQIIEHEAREVQRAEDSKRNPTRPT